MRLFHFFDGNTKALPVGKMYLQSVFFFRIRSNHLIFDKQRDFFRYVLIVVVPYLPFVNNKIGPVALKIPVSAKINCVEYVGQISGKIMDIISLAGPQPSSLAASIISNGTRLI